MEAAIQMILPNPVLVHGVYLRPTNPAAESQFFFSSAPQFSTTVIGTTSAGFTCDGWFPLDSYLSA
jgi:hypothetical protein